ncbi:MAG: stage II sporulation protein M [Candidatus Nanoarchaeia archaeon]
MVLENFLFSTVLKRKVSCTMILAFIYTSLALYFAHRVFQSQASLFFVVLITFLGMPFFWAISMLEKKKEDRSKNYLKLFIWSKSDKTLQFFVWFFLGVVFAVVFWYVLLPANLIQELFNQQLATIRTMNLAFTGSAIKSAFLAILANNIKVLFLSFLFAFLFGPGALFIITWNASVIGVAIGNKIRMAFATLYSANVNNAVVHYTNIISASILRYLTHGILEILAYFISILAGMLLSIAVLEKDTDARKTMRKTVFDVVGLLLLALGIIIIAGIIEVYVSANFWE